MVRAHLQQRNAGRVHYYCFSTVPGVRAGSLQARRRETALTAVAPAPHSAYCHRWLYHHLPVPLARTLSSLCCAGACAPARLPARCARARDPETCKPSSSFLFSGGREEKICGGISFSLYDGICNATCYCSRAHRFRTTGRCMPRFPPASLHTSTLTKTKKHKPWDRTYIINTHSCSTHKQHLLGPLRRLGNGTRARGHSNASPLALLCSSCRAFSRRFQARAPPHKPLGHCRACTASMPPYNATPLLACPHCL